MDVKFVTADTRRTEDGTTPVLYWMPSETIIQLLNILTKTNTKLNTIMSGQMSDIERSKEIENVADTVSGLEEGTHYFSPLSCLAARFEGLWNKI